MPRASLSAATFPLSNIHAPVLRDIGIVEIAGLAPAPFAAMMLADHGAEVIRIQRETRPPPHGAERRLRLTRRLASRA